MSERSPALVALDVVGRIAPPVGAAVAERLWFTPPRPRGAGRPLPPQLETATVRWRNRTLRGFVGGSGPLALLLHGWGGHAGQMAPLATALIEAGSSVAAITLPAHGADFAARRTDVFEGAQAVVAAVETHGDPHLVVAHSLGAMMAARALVSNRPPAVFVAPVLSIETAIAGFATQLDLTDAVTRRLEKRLRRYVGDEWSSLSTGSNLVWGQDLMLLHDPGDAQAPIDVSRAIAERDESATLTEIPGPGHHRILGNSVTIASTVAFAADRGVVSHPIGIHR